MQAHRLVTSLLTLGLLCISLGLSIDCAGAYPFNCQPSCQHQYQCYYTQPACCYPTNCYYTFGLPCAPLPPYPCSYPYPFTNCNGPFANCRFVYPTPYPACPPIYPW